MLVLLGGSSGRQHWTLDTSPFSGVSFGGGVEGKGGWNERERKRGKGGISLYLDVNLVLFR